MHNVGIVKRYNRLYNFSISNHSFIYIYNAIVKGKSTTKYIPIPNQLNKFHFSF